MPDRCTAGFAASVKTNALVEHPVAFASHVATVLKAALLSVPADPTAAVQAAAPHVTSAAAQVVAPTTGGVNEAASAFSVTLSCLVADARTIWSTVTEAALAAVLDPTFVTLNVMPDGTTTRACSLTFTETAIV